MRRRMRREQGPGREWGRERGLKMKIRRIMKKRMIRKMRVVRMMRNI